MRKFSCSDLPQQSDRTQILVEYRGFENEEPLWMDLEELAEDAPVLAHDYLEESDQTGLQSSWCWSEH